MDSEEELLEAPVVVVEPVEDETTFATGEEVDTMSEELQDLYTFFAGKCDQRIAHILVWDGAAKDEMIKWSLQDIYECYGGMKFSRPFGIQAVSNLFSSYLDSEVRMKEHYLPMLRTMATTELGKWMGMDIELFMLLLEKVPENGAALVAELFQDKPEVYYRMIQYAVVTSYYRDECEMLPCNQILTAEEFKKGLTQRPGGYEGYLYWLLLLAHCPESVFGELPDLLDDMPWGELIFTLRRELERSEKMGAKEHLFKIWGAVTKVEERKKLLQDLNTLKPQVCKETLEFLLSEDVPFPLDDLEGDEDQPCLVVECPTDSLGVKLFQHTMKTLGDFDMCNDLMELVDQQIEDSKLAAIIRDLVGQKKLKQTVAEEVASKCAEKGRVLSCAELVQVVPKHREDTFIAIVMEGNDETTCLKALEVLHPDLYHPSSLTCCNALHLTATRGFTALCKDILARGFHRLLEKKARILEINLFVFFHPASMAVQAAHFDTAKELLQAMKKSEAKALLTHHDDDPPEINLHHVAKEATQGCGRRWDREKDKLVPGPQKLVRKEIKERVDFIQAALDTTIDGHCVDLTILLADEDGQISEDVDSGKDGEGKSGSGAKSPDDDMKLVDFIQAALGTKDVDSGKDDEGKSGSGAKSPDDDINRERDQEEGEKMEGESGTGVVSPEDERERKKEKGIKQKQEKSLYYKIAESDFEDLKSHECFVTLTTIMWTDYGIMQGILFFLHLLFMAFLTTSLVLAARTSDPSEYDGSLDWFRLFCEIVTFLWTLTTLVLEIYELGVVIYKSVKKNFDRQTNRQADRQTYSSSDSDISSDSEENGENRKRFLALIKDILSNYLLDWQNILDDVAILCILLTILFRILNSDVQWVFAALAFLFHGLRIFKYAVMFKSVGEYVAILILLIKRDVPQFVTVFLVIIFSLGGGLYFALTGNYSNENIDTENNNDTSEIYLLWWTGIRILVEGSVLTYYGPGGFNWLGVLIYWLFLFIVTVVLLNILIAQFSKSYEEETERAQINVILTRTKIILKMEESFLTRFWVKLIKTVRRKLTRDKIDFSTAKRLHLTGEMNGSKPANSEQVEELQKQTTDLRLQLGKNISEVENTVTDTRQALHSLQSEVEGKLVGLERAVLDNRQTLHNLQTDVEGKLVGLERAVLDTRHFAEDIKEILMSMKEK